MVTRRRAQSRAKRGMEQCDTEKNSVLLDREAGELSRVQRNLKRQFPAVEVLPERLPRLQGDYTCSGFERE
ncbi:MAG TPA: hypothetical protein VFH46_16390 [Pyrinomonadaceae bacterium]|nr:hypothetical protein [Pyrinomonadaceae bacterium]